jgi:hypothetical protein
MELGFLRKATDALGMAAQSGTKHLNRDVAA